MTSLDSSLRERVAKILGVQMGGLHGVSKTAPANKAWYLKCEHMDYETEETATIFTNFDEQLDQLLALIKSTLKEVIGEREKPSGWIPRYPGSLAPGTKRATKLSVAEKARNQLRRETLSKIEAIL